MIMIEYIACFYENKRFNTCSLCNVNGLGATVEASESIFSLSSESIFSLSSEESKSSLALYILNDLRV